MPPPRAFAASRGHPDGDLRGRAMARSRCCPLWSPTHRKDSNIPTGSKSAPVPTLSATALQFKTSAGRASARFSGRPRPPVAQETIHHHDAGLVRPRLSPRLSEPSASRAGGPGHLVCSRPAGPAHVGQAARAPLATCQLADQIVRQFSPRRASVAVPDTAECFAWLRLLVSWSFNLWDFYFTS